MAKRTRITIETDSLLVLRERKSLWAWCPQYGAEAEMIPPNDVGVISNLGRRKFGHGWSRQTCITRGRLAAPISHLPELHA